MPYPNHRGMDLERRVEALEERIENLEQLVSDLPEIETYEDHEGNYPRYRVILSKGGDS